MSLLSFLGGVAEGMSEDIDRKRALADKQKLMESEAEKQIKLMKERSAEEERLYNFKRKSEKAAKEANRLGLYQSLNIPAEAAMALSKSGDALQPVILDYAKNNPNVDWNTVIKIQEQTGDNVTDVMKPTYALDTSVLFKQKPEKFSDLSTRLDSTMDAFVAAQIAGDSEEANKIKDQISIIKNSMVSDTNELDLLDATRIASLRKTDIALAMGSYVQETTSGEQKIQSILAGETFQFAEEFSAFQQAFKATTEPYLSNSANQQIVEAAYKSNDEILQRKLDTAIDRIEDIHFNEESTQENKIVHQVNGKDLIIREGQTQEEVTNIFKNIDANKNDVVKIMFLTNDGRAKQMRVLWGGSYDNSWDKDEGNFKYVSSSFGNNPFTNY